MEIKDPSEFACAWYCSDYMTRKTKNIIFILTIKYCLVINYHIAEKLVAVENKTDGSHVC